MKQDKSNPERPNPGILDRLGSVKNALHAVSDDIEGMLTRPAAPAQEPEIPTLSDVVSPSADPLPESSADQQLSRTNKHRAVSEADLQASTPAPEMPPQTAQPPRDTAAPSMPEAITSEAPTTEAMETGPTAELEDDAALVPDFDQLEAELGVEPLASDTGEEGEDEVEIHFDLDELEAESTPEPESGSLDVESELAGFSLHGTTRIELPAGSLFSNTPVEAASPTLPRDDSQRLTKQQLTALIEDVLDSHMVALQEALLEKLTPFVADRDDDSI